MTGRPSAMTKLVEEFLPNAPQHGLYVGRGIPRDKIANAVRDYAHDVETGAVRALYDATRFGSAKDGALFLDDRLVYQNNDLNPAQTIRYGDIVRVATKKKLLGGYQVELDVNAGRATVTHQLDFSARGAAAEYVARVLHEVMLAAPTREHQGIGQTDKAAVRQALAALVEAEQLAPADFERLLGVLR